MTPFREFFQWLCRDLAGRVRAPSYFILVVFLFQVLIIFSQFVLFCARSLLYDSVLVFSLKVLGVRRYGGYVIAGGKTLTPWDSPR